MLVLAAVPQPAHATRYLYASGLASPGIAAFAITPDATLRPVAGSPFATQSGGLAVAIAPDGRHVYAPGHRNRKHRSVHGRRRQADSPRSTAPRSQRGHRPARWRSHPTATTPTSRPQPTAGPSSASRSAPTGASSRLPDPPTHAGGLGGLASLAITPDGRHLYAASYIGSTITTYDIAADGRLRPRPGTPTASGQGSVWPSITPDGRHLYVSNEKDDDVSAYAISADGGLTELPGSPFATGNVPHPTQITPDGRFLYVPNVFSNTISAFSIAPDGALTPLPGSPYPGGAAGTVPGSIAIAPDGRHAYITEIGTLALPGAPTSHVHVYAIAPNGALEPLAAAPVTTGLVFSDGASSTITPNQGPTAAFSIKRRGRTRVTFDARGSHDPDGSIARYDWSFGDGTKRRDGGPTPTHRYRHRRSHRVTLTVTDNEGCSTRRIYTGPDRAVHRRQRRTRQPPAQVDPKSAKGTARSRRFDSGPRPGTRRFAWADDPRRRTPATSRGTSKRSSWHEYLCFSAYGPSAAEISADVGMPARPSMRGFPPSTLMRTK